MKRMLWAALVLLAAPAIGQADPLDIVGDVDGQPLGANVARLLQALEFLGSPLPQDAAAELERAAKDRNAEKIQQLLDPHVLLQVSLNPESRVKVARGPAEAVIQQHGYTPVIIKIVNDSTVKKLLRISSPQAGPIYSGGAAGNVKADKDRFLSVEMFSAAPMTAHLSGLKLEYALALISSSEAGKREATIGFDVGQGTQDLGFRGEAPVLFDVRPAVTVRVSATDFDGKPTVARLTFKDAQGRIYPPRAKRLAPDFFFQDQIYRPDGGIVLLPPGELTVLYGRGPEYIQKEMKWRVVAPGRDGKGTLVLPIKLERWINPMDFGFYSGDHHIHAAGCAHYTNPTEGVFASDMFLHVKGEGLNVGCNLTWGPCYEFQRQFFEPTIHKLSEPLCVLKYDLEISGFGSQAMGHVCLLNLKDQTYPGSEGTKTKGWPMWTTPVMKWAKDQGGFTGYAHSASGLEVNPQQAARQLISSADKNGDAAIDRDEASAAPLPMPEPFDRMDMDRNGKIDEMELVQAHQRTMGRLPNYCIPRMDGIGAQEICVTTAMGVCDFISAMDTARVPEWNCWYHIMNCGFPLKSSGETDFPCISGSRVGQGRVYVQLGKLSRIDYGQWCEGLAKGRSYISDGYAHALRFEVDGATMGSEVKLDKPGPVTVKAQVAFASEMPLGTSNGGAMPTGRKRLVELIVNGQAVAQTEVAADNQIHDIEFHVPIERSSWVALRHFPQMHTNPVNVIVAGKPIRASRRSALWCVGVIEQLWRVRGPGLPENERAEAAKVFDQALQMYRRIAADSPEGS